MNRKPGNSGKRISFWLGNSVFSVLVCVLLLLAMGWYREYKLVRPGSLVGNTASSVGALKEKGFPFSFLVMGDPQSTERGAALIKRAIQESPASFMILLGDFVNEPDIRYHHHFMGRMTREIQPPFPVFLAAGNHDIDYKESRKIGKERRVTPEVYESLYGARNFNFIFNDCLFIICEINEREAGSYLKFLRETLSQKAGGRKHIFIFTHHPPTAIGIPGDYPFPNQEEFFSLLEAYHVTSCFFGDYHAYWRVQRKGTNLIVSGGGGGSLKKYQPEWGKFHHLLRVTVDEHSVSEGMMIYPGMVLDLRGALKKWAYIHFFPLIGGWVLPVLFMCGLALAFLSVIIFSTLLLQEKRKGQKFLKR